MTVLDNTTDLSYPEDNVLTAEFIALYFIYAVIGFLTIVVNVFVVLLMRKFEYLRTETNVCLASLACSDFLCGIAVTPMVISCTVKYRLEVCLVMDLSQRFIAISTIMHLFIIALERYAMICHPMTYSRLVTKGRIIALLAGIWCFALLSCFIQLTWILSVKDIENSVDLQKTEIIYDLVWVFLLFCFPLIVILFAYTRILLIVRKQLNEIAKQINQLRSRNVSLIQKRRERKAIFVHGTMVVLFIATWFSYILTGLAYDIGVPLIVPRELENFLAILRHCSSLINPLLYSFLKEDFKRAYRRLFNRQKQ